MITAPRTRPLLVPSWVPHWFFAFATGVQLLMVATLVVVFVASHDNTLSVNALRAQNDAIREATAQQQAATTRFVNAFVAQENFICMVEAARAPSLGLQPPPAGLCSVKVPAP